MNGTFFNNPNFPGENNKLELVTLRQNINKKAKVYATFPNAGEWSNKIFSVIIENINNEDLILSDPANGNWYLVPFKFVDYIEFEEKINC